MIQNKLDLLFYRSGSSTDVGCHSLLKGLKTLCSIVEIRNRLMKRFCREICQLALEVTEGNGTLIEVGGLLHLIVACGSLYEKVHSPVLALTVHMVGLSVLCRYDSQSLSLRVAAVLDCFLFDPLGYMDDIFHELYRFFKNILVHSLKNITALSLLCLVGHTEGIIDMTASVRSQFLQSCFRQLKGCQNFCCDLFLVHFITPPKVSEDIFPRLLISEWLLQPPVCPLYR